MWGCESFVGAKVTSLCYKTLLHFAFQNFQLSFKQLEFHFVAVGRSCIQGGRRRLVGLSHAVSVPSEAYGNLLLKLLHGVPAVTAPVRP
jgi:hypothetical protein